MSGIAKNFLKRYALLHGWVLVLVVWFAAYTAVIHSRAAANAVTAVTQRIKDGFAAVWYIFPFSVVEWFYVAFILLVIVWLVVLAVRLRQGGARLHIAYSGLLSLACLCLSVWGFYCTMWGINYYADGFQEKSSIYAQPVAVDELERVTLYFVQQLGVYADQVERDERGVFAETRDSIFSYSTEVYKNAAKEFPFLERQDRVPKKMVFSRLFSAMNFTGFYTPFTGESNLNVDSPACLLPANISHELAHQRGIASEQECNFLAILAATTCENVVYRYSGYLMGYIHLGNALYRADRERWEQVYALLPETVLADLRYQSAYWEQFEGVTATVSKKIYDSTLKSYGQEDGIQSYGTVVDLLVTYY
ncbi:MAG: DUF3810 domain-containing protein [Oscillospiraceae bacterium]|nr:DUF3810 domain-containing protein [Oscillospiraceae bacterium]